jgi:hypothetical protein
MRIVKKYDNFVNENMEMAKSIVSKKLAAFDKLKTLLSNNIGYIGKFTEYLMDENIGYNDLELMYNDLSDLKKKNHPLDISKLSFEKASDKIIKTNNTIIVNSLLKQFPSEQKKLIDLESSSTFNSLLKVAKKENLKAFISKISRYKDKTTLVNALNLFSKDSNNDREHIKSTISSMDSSIIFENDSLIIVRVPVINDIQVLGSDTSWCILRETNWNSYTKNRLQFIVYDFSIDEHDPKFKIGFTLEKSGNLYAAHDILDHDSTSYLEKVLNNNDLTFSKIVLMDKSVKRIDASDIDSITSKSTLASIELFINELTDDKSVAYKLLIKLFDIFGYLKTDKNGDVVNKVLTGPKYSILNLAVKALFAQEVSDTSKVITTESFNDMDKRVQAYIKEKNMFYDIMYSPDKISLSCRKALFDYGLSRWSNAKILELLYESSDNEFLNVSTWKVKDIDFSKPISDDSLKFGRQTLTKLSDRANKVYLEGTAKFNREYEPGKVIDTTSKSFGRSVIFLNYILGRKDKCPDHDKLLDMCLESSYDINYPGLFTDTIDISRKSYVQSSTLKVDKLEKKDYPDTPIFFRAVDLFDVQKIITHLDGYKMVFKGSESTFKEILKKPHHYANLNDYGKKILNMIKKMPEIKTGKSITDGNITLIVS